MADAVGVESGESSLRERPSILGRSAGVDTVEVEMVEVLAWSGIRGPMAAARRWFDRRRLVELQLAEQDRRCPGRLDRWDRRHAAQARPSVEGLGESRW